MSMWPATTSGAFNGYEQMPRQTRGRNGPRHTTDNIIREQNRVSKYHSIPTRTTRTRSSAPTPDHQNTLSLPSPPITPQKIKTSTVVDCEPIVERALNIKKLPVEVLQEIAKYLPSDKDAIAYSQVCRMTWACMNDSVYRQRFLRRFDEVVGADQFYLSGQYKIRATLARHYVAFDNGFAEHQAGSLALMRALITESNAKKVITADGTSMIVGNNQEFLRAYATQINRMGTFGGTNILDAMCRTEKLFVSAKASRSSGKCASLPLLIQLCLLHLSLDPDLSTCLSNLQNRGFLTGLHHCIEAQKQVYKCFGPEPLFLGAKEQDINIAWVLQVANFFKFHLLKHDSEGIYAERFIELPMCDRPRAWLGRLQTGTQQLAKKWKGTYCYMTEMEVQLARSPVSDEALVDVTGEHNDGFQDLTLFFDIKGHPELHFPHRAEEYLNGNPKGPFLDPLTGENKLPEVKDFFGLGYDGKKYHLNGRVHALPPQQLIPGFQRVTMMKYFPDHKGHYGGGSTQLWAYEGVVIPGGQIMIGRWWSPSRGVLPDGGSYCGPFIYWAVDEKPEDRLMTIDAALEFLDSIVDSAIW